MRFHRPKRRQSASTSTWPPCAVAWSELVRRRCRVDFCFVNNGMDTHHHKGDVAASTISPAIAFLFTRLRIGVHHTSGYARGILGQSQRWSPRGTDFGRGAAGVGGVGLVQGAMRPAGPDGAKTARANVGGRPATTDKPTQQI